MAKHYRTSGRPLVASNTTALVAERGKRSRDDVTAMADRIKADQIHKRRSEGQRIRQSRERLYGKMSHLVVVRRIGEPA
jgi:hypothetical protein